MPQTQIHLRRRLLGHSGVQTKKEKKEMWPYQALERSASCYLSLIKKTCFVESKICKIGEIFFSLCLAYEKNANHAIPQYTMSSSFFFSCSNGPEVEGGAAGTATARGPARPKISCLHWLQKLGAEITRGPDVERGSVGTVVTIFGGVWHKLPLAGSCPVLARGRQFGRCH